MYDTPEERAKWRAECESNGVSWAKAVLPNRAAGIQEHIREWLEEQNEQQSRAAVDAARDSAKAATAAAIASEKSARWTMIAAIVAFIGILVQAFAGS